MDVNLTAESKIKLDPDAKIPFTYEVKWIESKVKFDDRFDKYLDPNFFQHRVNNSYILIFDFVPFFQYLYILYNWYFGNVYINFLQCAHIFNKLNSFAKCCKLCSV